MTNNRTRIGLLGIALVILVIMAFRTNAPTDTGRVLEAPLSGPPGTACTTSGSCRH